MFFHGIVLVGERQRGAGADAGTIKTPTAGPGWTAGARVVFSCFSSLRSVFTPAAEPRRAKCALYARWLGATSRSDGITLSLLLGVRLDGPLRA